MVRVKWFLLLPVLILYFSADTAFAQGSKTPIRDALEKADIYFSKENQSDVSGPVKTAEENIDYDRIVTQSLIALGVQHSLRFTQEKTRAELGGPFLKDWFRSVGSINGWGDGDGFMANWVGHPMMGATAAFIFAQNDKVSQQAEFGWNKKYFRAKKRQFIFAVIYSEQFELGPISESSIGNVGMRGKGHGFVDHVITPIVGVWVLSVAEDAADAKIIRPLMRKNKFAGSVLALLLNHNRSAANIVAGRWPWYREKL